MPRRRGGRRPRIRGRPTPIINDITDRKYQPNPGRKPRERDKFFDWLHGKWHDTFCPVGPCLLLERRRARPPNLPRSA